MLSRLVNRLLVPENERKLLPVRRINGPMPWIIGVIMFLTVILLAVSIGIGAMALSMRSGMDGQITVQILAASAQERSIQTNAALRVLADDSAVLAAAPLPEEEAAALVEPWLGPDAGSSEFPLPALIDAELQTGTDQADLMRLETALKQAAPSARLDRQSDIAAPLSNLLNTLALITLALVLLLLLAMAAIVMLTTRGALANNRQIIDTIHLLGGTDKQVGQLFQRRIAIDALLGGLVGFVPAMLVLWLLAMQLDDTGFGFSSGPFIPWYGWVIISLLPILGAGLARLIAGKSIKTALRKML